MNVLWAGMIIVGVVYGGLTGNLGAVSQAALDSAESAISLCITMLGIMSFWMGLMEIATKAGVIQVLSKKLKPVFHWLFPHVPIGSRAQEYITTNMIANLLGLGWAATPAGLKAMEELEKISDKQEGYASDEMCTLLVLNISSLQLIPINVIAYRSEYGSVSPTMILGPAIIATAVSTLVGIWWCKTMSGRRRRLFF